MLDAADHMEILNLYARFNHAYDAASDEEFANCFTEDGSFERPDVNNGKGAITRGRAELLELVRKKKASNPIQKRHISLNILIDADGDGARGSAYQYVMTDGADGVPPRLHSIAVSEDRFVKIGDGWRFIVRVNRHKYIDLES